MAAIVGINPGWGMTAVRIAMGIIFVVAGYQKFAGGVGGVSAYFAKMSIPLAGFWGVFIPTLELVGGILLILGFATRWLGLLFVCEFIVAAFWVKFPTQGWSPGRIDLMLLAGAILLFLAGPGKAALDRLWLEKNA